MKPRSGLTLLETILALLILMVGMSALGQMIRLGGQQAEDAHLLSRAFILCQGKLAEVIAGAEPLAGDGGYSPFSDQPDWEFRIDSKPGEAEGLYQVQVFVRHPRVDGSMLETSLSQWILEPSIRGSTLDRPTGTTLGGAK